MQHVSDRIIELSNNIRHSKEAVKKKESECILLLLKFAFDTMIRQ